MDPGVRRHDMIYEPGVRFVQQGTEIPLAGIAALSPVSGLPRKSTHDSLITSGQIANHPMVEIATMGIPRAFRT
jgi:hypothetical protein